MSGGRVPRLSEADFVTTFEAWWRTHADSHRCVVGLDPAGAVVAFGFVALTSRVPGPHVPSRCSADVQAVFVVPERRNAGIGGRLVERLVGLAREDGAEHVTVHSSEGAVTAYERAGFTRDPLMLNQVL
jgi:GNAT superfamily N-acetyltransferase